MEDLGLDFETYYDDDYTLKKMENSEYVMDGRFEITMCSYKFRSKPAVWLVGTMNQIAAELRKLDWKNIRLISHNMRFDGSILEWRLGIRAAEYLCTMVGSRPHLVPYAGGQSLHQIARYLKLGVKGDAVIAMKGKHLADLTPVELEEYATYCVNDTELAIGIADHLLTIMPADELKVIDATLKKYLRPELLLDKKILDERLEDVRVAKAKLLIYIEETYKLDLEGLRSKKKFAARLETELFKHGERAPLKTNKKGQPIFAFAKDDPDMKKLLTHRSLAVRELCAAKLEVGSSLEESRLERLSKLHEVMGGKLPVPLVYYGAHTGRFSGDEKINLQNLPRVVYNKDGTLKKGHLRFALRARPGYSIVAADLSNIEARIVATLSGQLDLVEGFRRGEDIYSQFASRVYGYEVRKDTHPKERFVGKTCILGLGYGMGAKKFHLKMIQEGIEMDDKEAARVVYLYRDVYNRIPMLWSELESIARRHMTNRSALFPWRNGITFASERIILPNDMPIMYPGLTTTVNNFGGRGLGFRSRYGRQLLPEDDHDDAGTTSVWGGAFTENISQALARIILTRAELILAAAGLPAVLQVHDELVYHVPTAIVLQVKIAIEKVMTAVVPWMENLPVAVEIHDGPTYGDAK